jgi:hypothetical protein
MINFIQYPGRGKIWIDSIYRIIENPILGYGASPYKLEKDKSWYRAHNMIIEAFLQTGVIGGVLFLIVIFTGIRDSFICLIYDPNLGWLSLIFLIIAIFSLVDSVLISNYMLWFSLITLRANVVRLDKIRREINNDIEKQ